MRKSARWILAVVAIMMASASFGQFPPPDSCYYCFGSYDTLECVQMWGDGGTYASDCHASCTFAGWYLDCYCYGGHCEWL